MQQLGNDLYQVEFRVFDVFKSQQLGGFRYKIPGKSLRKLAHQISDIIYEKLTGDRGGRCERPKVPTSPVVVLAPPLPPPPPQPASSKNPVNVALRRQFMPSRPG